MKLGSILISVSFLSAVSLFNGCTSSGNHTGERKGGLPPEDKEAKRSLQGIWIDKETETVLFYAKGDSIFYPDTTNVPLRFFVCQDTLYMAGGDTVAYPIDKIGAHFFKFHSVTGDIVELVRSENPADTLYFTHKQTATLTYNEVVKKDTVVYHGGDRYHCYVYVNPSRLKVRKTNYTDEGIAVENVYYDNVIHICVYKGRTCLFSRDYSKKSFTGMVPESFLGQAILSNMEFDRADRDGCHFNATVCIPDDAGCYMVGICVDYAGKPEMELLEY